ncbi:GNAT family N-acetyltransferase [Microvirga sp. GCM10011540]|uniref:GNAT family N-acetyltransferase n=1 Tax=Microvirga sp. GCM10011540 TaxID=3317338 RepID=UPI00362452A8
MKAVALEDRQHESLADARKFHRAGLRTVSVREFDALHPHCGAWDRLAWHAPQRNAYLLSGWFEAAFRHALAGDEQWFCSFAYSGDELVGVLPAIVSPHPILGRKYPILRTFDKHSQSGEVLLAPEHSAVTLQALLMEAAREEPRHVGLDMKAVRSNSPLWTAIRGGVPGYFAHRGWRYSYSFLDVQGEYESYLKTLGNMRKNLGRYHRKLQSRGQVCFEVKRGSAAQEDFLEEFLALEASGWKGRNGTAIASKSDSTEFYKALVRNLATRGQLEWHTMRVNNHLVAAEMGIRCGAALVLPKTAYDENYADCRPGNLLNAAFIGDAFSRSDLIELNDMSDMEWHSQWRMSRDEYVNLHLVRRGSMPMLFQSPRILLRSAYQDHIRPRIPANARKAWHWVRRPSRRPNRAAEHCQDK